MLRQVRGLGTLVPEDILWIPALTDGRVEKILVRPGTGSDRTPFCSSEQSAVELEALNAEWQIKTAEATYSGPRGRLKNQKLDQQAAAARVASEYATGETQCRCRSTSLAKTDLRPM